MKQLMAMLLFVAAMVWLSGPIQAPDPGTAQAQQDAAAPSQEHVPVYQDVASIFDDRCTMCHSGSQPPLGLRLDSYANLIKGSQNGPVVVAGDPQGSELVRRIRGISQPRMPLTGPPWLSDKEVELIEGWIAGGAAEGNQVHTPEKAPQKAPLQAGVTHQPLTYTHIAPILGQRCVKCHMENGQMGPPPEGLRLDSYASVVASHDRARIIPGNPDASELVRRIRGQSLPPMPFDGPPYLDQAEIELIVRWVKQGARNAEGTEAPLPVGARVRLEGRLDGRWSLDGLPLVVDGATRLKKAPSVGDYVRVRGLVQNDGKIRATRIRPR